jgi:hypothetical protein
LAKAIARVANLRGVSAKTRTPNARNATPATMADTVARYSRLRRLSRYRGRGMAGKKDTDATKNLPPEEPTQVLPKGTRTGLPTRKRVEDALARIAKKKPT